MFAFMEIFVNLQWVMFSENSSQCKLFWKEAYMYHNTLEQGYELANAYDTCKKTSPYMLSHGGGVKISSRGWEEIRYFIID